MRALLEDVNYLVAAKRKEPSQHFQLNCDLGLPLYQDLFKSMTTPPIDFDDTSNIRQSKGGKKTSKAQKQASKNSWGSGDEENKYGGGGAGEDNGGGGEGHSNGAGGAGGDGGGDDGGDDWNNWSASSNKKKKGKKNRGGVDDDEDQKKEEEESKNKTQEDAINGGSLSWADEAGVNQDDNWGSLSTGKKGKKGKKDKVSTCFMISMYN